MNASVSSPWKRRAQSSNKSKTTGQALPAASLAVLATIVLSQLLVACGEDVCEAGGATIILDVTPSVAGELAPAMVFGPCLLVVSAACTEDAGSACVGYGLAGVEAGSCTVQFTYRSGEKAGLVAFSRVFNFSATSDCCPGSVCTDLPRGSRRVSVP